MKRTLKAVTMILLVAIMAAALCVPALAAAPSPSDTAEVIINNIAPLKNGNYPTVTLYKIVEGNYVDGGLTGYKVVEAISGASNTAYNGMTTSPTPEQVTALAADLKKDPSPINLGTPVTANVNDGTAKATVGAGTYLVLVTGSDGKIYNPMIVSAYYKSEDGTIIGGTVDANSNWVLDDVVAYAKSSEPTIDKSVTGNPADDISDDGFDGDEHTSGSVGDTVTFTVVPTIPSYPENAVNKTFYISDTMQTGLTFDGTDSIKIFATIDGTESELSPYTDYATVGQSEGQNGFNLSFNYDALKAAGITDLRVTYTATINDSAVIGQTGNTNKVTLYYATDSTSGSTYDDITTPPPQEDENIVTKEDETIVYTYELMLHKKGEGADAEALAGAVFGIYDADGNLVDVVVTNDQGYAATTRVGAGTYTIKELIAPPGYSLNTTEYTVEVKWSTATKTTTTTSSHWTYTSDITEAEGYDAETNPNPPSVGWLKDNKFYTHGSEEEGYVPAYIKSAGTTSSSETTVIEGSAGAGVAISPEIPNTKLGELPSTGGIGTYLFTFGGIAVMALAIGLIVRRKKRASRKTEA